MKSIKLKLLIIFSSIIFMVGAGIIIAATTVTSNHMIKDVKEHLMELSTDKAQYIKEIVKGRPVYLSSPVLRAFPTS